MDLVEGHWLVRVEPRPHSRQRRRITRCYGREFQGGVIRREAPEEETVKMYIDRAVDSPRKARKNDKDSSGIKWEGQQPQQRRATDSGGSRVLVFNATGTMLLFVTCTEFRDHCTRLCTCRHWVSDNVSIQAFARVRAVGVPTVQICFRLGCMS